MTSTPTPDSRAGRTRQNIFLTKFRKSTKGTTAIEFAMVGIPFMMMMFGILTLGLFFFTTFAFENAVERSARLVRTGQAQAAVMTEAEFKANVCNLAPSFVDCQNNLKVFVQSFPDNVVNLAPADCVVGNALNTTSFYDLGNENEVILVTACYEWDMTFDLPFLKLGNIGSSGHRLIQAVATFRSEPFAGGS